MIAQFLAHFDFLLPLCVLVIFLGSISLIYSNVTYVRSLENKIGYYERTAERDLIILGRTLQENHRLRQELEEAYLLLGFDEHPTDFEDVDLEVEE